MNFSSNHFTMAYKYFLTILFSQFHLFETFTLLSEKKILSTQLDLTKFIEYPYKQECLQIVLDPKQQQQRLFLGTSDNISVHIRSKKSLKVRDISTEHEGQCETFLIFTETIDMVNEIFQFNQSIAKQFFPFTKIYFHLNRRSTTNLQSMSTVRKFLIQNALFGYVFEYEEDNESRMVIRDLLTNDVKKSIRSYIPHKLLHPTVNTNLVKDNFRISLFNCTPYTIYSQYGNDDETLVNPFLNEDS